MPLPLPRRSDHMKETAAPTLFSQSLHALPLPSLLAMGLPFVEDPREPIPLPHATTPRQVGMEGGALFPAPTLPITLGAVPQ